MLALALAAAVAAALAGCSFDPDLAAARILCDSSRGNADCPRGYTCEEILQAAARGLNVCCARPGCTDQLDTEELRRIGEAVVSFDAGAVDVRVVDAPAPPPMACGNGRLDPGEACDPLTSCPTECKPDGCRLRRLANPGSCLAACVDDGTQTVCANDDGCCPAACNANTDSDCTARCGNGTVEGNELCDGDCPRSCPNLGCTRQKLEGSAATCNARCVDDGHTTTCTAGDSCCPAGCTTVDDADCACTCGNGKVEPVCGEVCDPLSSCPQSCPAMGCMLRRLVNGGTCQAACVADGMQTMCLHDDGCCPAACNANNDRDCTPRCGNGTTESGETCDPPGKCPQSCPWMGCQRRKLEGAAAGCNAACADDGTQSLCAHGDGCCPAGCNNTNDGDCAPRCGNGVREGSETCDGNCPTSCPAMGCQRRRLQGSAGGCDAACVDDTAITSCTAGDGCCPASCNANNDPDCTCTCGNGATEGACGEKCDGANCPTSCPNMGCTLFTLQGTACTRECVGAGMRTTCANADGCCPPGCNAGNDNDCTAVCSGTTDAYCPPMCMPCGASCAAGQDIDCKLANGATCSHNNQCGTACVDARCCAVAACAGVCQWCRGANGTCAAIPRYTEDTLPANACTGANSCNGSGACLKDNGQTCGAGTECASGACADGVCCENACTGACQSCALAGMLGSCRPIASGPDLNGTPACMGGQTCVAGACKLADGTTCSAAADCGSGVCSTFFRDVDGDMQGLDAVTGRFCGLAAPAGWAVARGDCCDSDVRAKVGQTTYYSQPNNCGVYDFNCDGIITRQFIPVNNCMVGNCLSSWQNSLPDCGEPGTWRECGGQSCQLVSSQMLFQRCR